MESRRPPNPPDMELGESAPILNYDVSSGKETRLVGTAPPSPSGHCWAGNDAVLLMQRMPLEPGRFTRVEVATRKETILFEEPRVGDTSCSADGRIVGYSYSAANGTSFRVRNVETGALTDVPLPSPVSAVALSPDGAQLAYIGAAS